MDFINFKDVDVDDSSTWKGKAILTFDIDWASDEQINFVLDLLEPTGKKACFFVTHDTPVLERIRANKNFEFGLHPNFNPLILGESIEKKAVDIVNDLKKIVPEANVLRSHSMTTSGRWLGMYKSAGMKLLSNYLMYGIEDIKPFRQINGLVEIPVYFADDGFVYLNDTKEIANPDLGNVYNRGEGIKIFNFHPVHIFINSISFADYKEFNDKGIRNKIDGTAKGIYHIYKTLINL